MGMAFHHHFCALDSINLILSCPWVPGGRTPVLVSWLAKRAGGDTPLRKSPFDVVITHKFFMALSRFSSGALTAYHFKFLVQTCQPRKTALPLLESVTTRDVPEVDELA